MLVKQKRQKNRFISEKGYISVFSPNRTLEKYKYNPWFQGFNQHLMSHPHFPDFLLEFLPRCA